MVCADAAEGARAARRAGLRLAVATAAEGAPGQSRYTLALASAEGEKPLAKKDVALSLDENPVPPLQAALRELMLSAPREPLAVAASAKRSRGPWIVGGVGAASLIAGTVLAISAGSAAEHRDALARQPGFGAEYARRDSAWQHRRIAAGVTLSVGAVALAGAAVWRFAF